MNRQPDILHTDINSVAVLILALCLAACAPLSAVPSPVASPQEAVHIKVGTLPYVSSSILQIAASEGYFAEQGLAVELVLFQSSNEQIPLLLTGELDAATPALNAGFFNAVARGGKLKIALPLITYTVRNCATAAFVARKADVAANSYTDPAQWAGARVALPAVGSQGLPGYVVDRLLSQVGLGLADIELPVIDVAAQADALLAKQIDIVYAVEPWVTRMTAGDSLVLLRPAEPIVPDMTTAVIVYGAKLLDNPDLGERFAIAFLKAARQYRQGNTPRNVELVAAYTGLDQDLVRRFCWSDIPADGRVNEDSIMAFQAWLRQQGLLDQTVASEKYLDLRFVEAANRALGAVVP